MHYSQSPNHCRVDFFRPSGKWYTTETINFSNETFEMHPSEALSVSLDKQLDGRLSDMIAVCLEPYVEHPFPVCRVPK